MGAMNIDLSEMEGEEEFSIDDSPTNIRCRRSRPSRDGLQLSNDRGHVRMKKSVGLISGICFVVGNMLGAGIFITPKGVLQASGSVGMSLVVWAVGGVLALMGSLTYAELGTLVKRSGGEYSFFIEAKIPIFAFLFVWTSMIVLQASATAVGALVFAEYMISLFGICGIPILPQKMISVCFILTVCIINCYDTRWVSAAQVMFTVVNLLAVTTIIIGGFVKMSHGDAISFRSAFAGTTDSPSMIALSFYDAMWTYEGWNYLYYVTEELVNPHVNLPRASIIGVLIVILMNILAVLSYIAVLGVKGLLSSKAVAVDWSRAMLGSVWWIIPVSVLFSTFGLANSMCFASGRLLYAAARENHLPEILSFVNVRRYTPIPSMVFTCLLAVAMVIPTGVDSLIDLFGFTSWVIYFAAAVCLIILRFTKKDAERPIKVCIMIPATFIVCSMFLVVAPIVQDPKIELLWSALFIFSGLLLYVAFVVFKVDRGCFDYVTMVIQLLCEVVPSPFQPEN